MFNRNAFDEWIMQLRAAVQSDAPTPLLIPAAIGLQWIADSEGWGLPDWVQALANGNPNRILFDDLLKITRLFIKGEEES